jgi:hypothetical protein
MGAAELVLISWYVEEWELEKSSVPDLVANPEGVP